MTDRKPTGYIRHDGTNYAAFLEPDIAEQRQRCKCCGAALEGSTPARPEEPKEKTWHDRDKLT
jgi:hypothetical protein